MREDAKSRAVKKLIRYLAMPTKTHVEDGAPLLQLKDGRVLRIERCLQGYEVSWNYGFTYKPFAFCKNVAEIVDVIFAECEVKV